MTPGQRLKLDAIKRANEIRSSNIRYTGEMANAAGDVDFLVKLVEELDQELRILREPANTNS